MPNTAVDYLHVVAAVIRDATGNILLAQRPANKHQGGKWEFPGGKVESGETPQQALSREVHEELGISVEDAAPLIKVRYVYPERAVLLDVWEVTAFSGEAHGREGQPVAWFHVDQLSALEFPPANAPIVNAARLPAHCLITPEPQDSTKFLQQLVQRLQAGVRLIVFRAKTLDAAGYVALAHEVIRLGHSFGATIMLNSPPEMLVQADGLHLTSRQLFTESAASIRDTLLPGQWLSASCHSVAELQQVAMLGADFAFLSPVLPTLSHPGEEHLGWEVFAAMVDQVNIPVYALGGMDAHHVSTARHYGGQGIAAIRRLWDV
ncbi:8-oxo-dGTP diphosphatase [Thiothrix caldifontis]|uniref:8-oxo-dGTP diphosphatase n=1 Tax=Thiothrix caldifontis TaxID=525918 RepID=A0A1H4D6P2_9GAMM|nr:Nudix family hydrolase [Thiothrix caldifontis]SEA68523.1 8-oxo-dGTP diphosphatase [Thiothrix caldifontis]